MSETNNSHIMSRCPHCNQEYEAAVDNNPLVKNGLIINPLPVEIPVESDATALDRPLLAYETLARAIIKRVSDSALEVMITRNDIEFDAFDQEDYPGRDGVDALKEFIEELKTDTLKVLTGDETGCVDREDLDASNCELIYLVGIIGADDYRSALALASQSHTDTQAAPCGATEVSP